MSITDFMPLYRAPHSARFHAEHFYTHPERAELTINHPQFQTLIYAVARTINKQRNHIYNVDDIAEHTTQKLLQVIIEKNGLEVDSHYLQSPRHMGNYFKRFVSWRMKDLLKKDPYWKRWTQADLKELSDDQFGGSSDRGRQTLSHGDRLARLEEITNHLVAENSIQLSALNRLKYMMLYSPQAVSEETVHLATQKSNQKLASSERIWQSWQANQSTYNQIRKEDHKDLKRSRTFCTWSLFKPHLNSITEFEAEPDSKTLRENRFNRPVNRCFHQIVNQSAVYILMNHDIESAEPLISELLINRNVKRRTKEKTAEYQRRKRQYLAILSKELHAWSHRFSMKPMCLGSIQAIARMIHSGTTVNPHSIATLERIEQSVKSFNSNYR